MATLAMVVTKIHFQLVHFYWGESSHFEELEIMSSLSLSLSL